MEEERKENSLKGSSFFRAEVIAEEAESLAVLLHSPKKLCLHNDRFPVEAEKVLPMNNRKAVVMVMWKASQRQE